ncbi:RlpA-like double-psi beta-barrel-protein domain-containing protein-containing protein [Pseudomassariella vexata]|uniref:RlpA-like double-psi beta-barrel-protein domain-containing protein-containing protein n=1 Tax=Pseudomassariella vexata TaxID=1141098 RepID=A0A1Y2DH55_9PEZI|nr:RlpA-like double-psi beta-barrel-protein domain-containing protein-containing protein [Pseudomassariella vexata]ORY58578.1 RlpA-like double-psi beta-barrel-protein domain-containing protein-containing protein [Pseudomassariella vexata]
MAKRLSALASATFQTPEWETPTDPKRSFWTRFLPSKAAAGASANPVDKTTPATQTFQAHTTTLPGPYDGAKPTFAESMYARFDKLMPIDRTYLGRSRRFFLQRIAIPLLILFLVVLALAVGLGVGLSRRASSKSQNLSLPSNADVFTGDLTYYDPGLGACGATSSDSDSIVSVSHILFDAASTGSNPNANPLCGKKIRITREFSEADKGNTSVDVTVVDRCVGCLQTDLDVTISVFTQLALEASGRVVMSWAWLN